AEHSGIEVIVSIRPERVVGVGIEGVIDEVVVGVGPEQRARPSDDEHGRASKVAPERRSEESALERRAGQLARAGVAGRGAVGENWIAQYAARDRPAAA